MIKYQISEHHGGRLGQKIKTLKLWAWLSRRVDNGPSHPNFNLVVCSVVALELAWQSCKLFPAALPKKRRSILLAVSKDSQRFAQSHDFFSAPRICWVHCFHCRIWICCGWCSALRRRNSKPIRAALCADLDSMSDYTRLCLVKVWIKTFRVGLLVFSAFLGCAQTVVVSASQGWTIASWGARGGPQILTDF